MDKIDEILIKYKEGGKISQEAKQFLIIIILFLIVVIEYGLFAIFFRQLVWFYMSGLVLAMMALKVLTEVYNGTLGTKKSKQGFQSYNRYRFIHNQKRLQELIRESGLTNQQVYNLLLKRRILLPPKRDNAAYMISLCSIAIAITNTFISPLGSSNNINYASYVAIAIVVLFFCSVGLFFGSNLFIALNKSYEVAFLEKYNYEYIIKLLEDLLY